MTPNLTGKICLVTGASRGIGKGIALQLAQAGATVYITGRSKGALEECAEEMRNRGASEAFPLIVDHSNDEEVESLFKRVKDEKGGLDVLVNNAYAGVNRIFDNTGKPFWECDPPGDWDIINNVGLRNHYLCTSYAARIMTPKKQGLIVNVSSIGGLKYLFNVPYGIGKSGCDRMAADCAHELKRHNVAMVSLWPGAVQTETIKEKIMDNPDAPKASKHMFEEGETTEFSGMAIANLAADPKIMDKTGKILMTSHLAREYGFTDIGAGGGTGMDILSVKYLLHYSGWKTLASWTPGFLRAPLWVLHFGSYRF